ncbi:ATP-binding cassette domain-containing protein [Luedemannella helvata]|uniref:ATP-binding cassette domain-containing protein n=1 Tax=Luedemannella helvata TaxID=349315 RepID=A0ABP4WC02_9ACTN
MAAVIEIENLRKTYVSLLRGKRVALNGFDMQVTAGQVHGFLGPNGSGKTTTLRTLLGLARADSGRMFLFGQPVPQALPAVVHRFGAIVESPQFFRNFTGRRTLSLLARVGGLPDARVDQVLELVGMRERGDEKVKTYSLGMKQRLAVATALLKSPELLILDEPANGLDPAGIREMRDLVRGLAAAGSTVLVSSHLLDEIEQICDSVTIISRGKRVAAGPVADVLATQDKGEHLVGVRDDDRDRAAELLSAAGLSVVPRDGRLVVGGVSDPARVSEVLGSAGVWLTELSPLTPDLESVFLTITGTTPEPGTHRPVDESRDEPWPAPTEAPAKAEELSQ